MCKSGGIFLHNCLKLWSSFLKQTNTISTPFGMSLCVCVCLTNDVTWDGQPSVPLKLFPYFTDLRKLFDETLATEGTQGLHLKFLLSLCNRVLFSLIINSCPTTVALQICHLSSRYHLTHFTVENC